MVNSVQVMKHVFVRPDHNYPLAQPEGIAKLDMPTTTGITIEVRTASAAGTLLASVASNADGRDYELGPFVYST